MSSGDCDVTPGPPGLPGFPGPTGLEGMPGNGAMGSGFSLYGGHVAQWEHVKDVNAAPRHRPDKKQVDDVNAVPCEAC